MNDRGMMALPSVVHVLRRQQDAAADGEERNKRWRAGEAGP
jgi:hypothetical protein